MLALTTPKRGPSAANKKKALASVSNYAGTTSQEYLLGETAGERAGLKREADNVLRAQDDSGDAVAIQPMAVNLENRDDVNNVTYTTTLKSKVLENLEIAFANSPTAGKRQNLTILDGDIEFSAQAAGAAKGGLYFQFNGTHPEGVFTVFTADVDYVVNFVFLDVWSVATGARLGFRNQSQDGHEMAFVDDTDGNLGGVQRYETSFQPILEAGSELRLEITGANSISGRFAISLSPVGTTVDAATLS